MYTSIGEYIDFCSDEFAKSLNYCVFKHYCLISFLEMTAESPTKQSFSHHLTNASNQNGTGRVTLTWDNLNLTILAKDVSKSKIFRPQYKYKRILRNLSGRCVSGELLAIMGPTGKFSIYRNS
jgi:hypothetical protein